MFIMDKMCPRCLFDFTTEDDSQVYCPDCEEYIAEHPDWQLLELSEMTDSVNFSMQLNDADDEALDNEAGYAELVEYGAFDDE